jgi:hypothetical protein
MRSKKRDLWLVLTSSGCTAVIVVALTFGVRALAALDSNEGTESLPRVVPYEGVLDVDGAPYTGFLDFKFTLYDAPTGGNAVWTEEWTQSQNRAIQVFGGRFAAALGSYDDGGLRALADVIADADPIYLGVQVKHTAEGDDGWVALNGRQRLNPVPYALWSTKSTDLEVGHDLDVSRNTTVGGTLDVTGNTTLGGTLGVAGATTIHNNATVTGTATVVGAATFNNNVGISGSETVTGGATISSGAVVNGGLTVNNGTTINGGATVNSGLVNTSTLNQRGNIANDQGDVTIADSFTVTGQTNLNGYVTFGQTDVNFANGTGGRGNGGRALVYDANDTLVVNYSGDMSGGTRVDSALTVAGTVRFNGAQTIAGGQWPACIPVVMNDGNETSSTLCRSVDNALDGSWSCHAVINQDGGVDTSCADANKASYRVAWCCRDS